MELSTADIALMSRLLDEALPLDDAGRHAWLERLSPEHRLLAPGLRAALLRGVAQEEVFRALATPPKFDTEAEVRAVPTSGLQSGVRLGPYELIRLLGAGGMAEVWLARRADGAFTREVALKLPMLTRLQAGLEARFARERDILASLEHPHIARLYDAGVGAEGLPYLSMEYVQGEPLTDWCDAHRLGIPERLRLFLQVLEAVQYAHEKHVIHRDLKPSNILVTESGQARLLDFGVARLLEAEKTDQTELTSVYGRALTPDYASPELLRGDPIDARSDLYSLGVLLYELLSGTRPYRLKSAASIGLLDQAIATLEVKKPSMQLEQAAATTRSSTVEQLARQLRGDLDAIVLMALAKEPAQRYPSAAALTEDLRRFLDGKPIRARPARIAYRLGKFVRRNGTLLGVSVAALAAILAAVGYALYRESRAQVTVSAKALAAPAAPSPASPVAAFAPPAHSIAVLPFMDMSEHRDQGYFADGLSEELIDLLTKVPDLRVPARTSSFYFKGKPTPLAKIAKALNVANVLEGSVRKSGHALRITAHMIRVDSGYDVWSQTYDGDMKDIFRLQDEIAGAVVQALKVQLLTNNSAASRTTNMEAYSLLLQGRYLNVQNSEEDLHRATEVLHRAVILDPSYAMAWAELSQSYVNLAANVDTDPASDWKAGSAAIQKALALNPTNAAGHYLFAIIKLASEHDWDGAAAEMDAARRADPDLTEPVELVFVTGCGSGPCHDKYISDISRDIERDPFNASALDDRGVSRYYAGELEVAESDLRRALEVSPRLVDGKYFLARVLAAQNKAAEALLVVDSMPESPYRRTGRAIIYLALGRKVDADAALQELLAKDSLGFPYQIAGVFAARGDIQSAVDWLQRDYDRKMYGILDAKVDPLLKPLAREPRFIALMNKFAPSH